MRQSANNTKCVSQVREWGRVINMYALENKGMYYTKDWASVATNESTYRRYFTHSNEEIKKMRLCPSDPATVTNLALNTAQSLRPTYALSRGSVNGTLATVASENAIPLGRARTPSQYILMMDSLPNSNVGITPTNLADFQNYIGKLIESEHAQRHGTKFNAVFGDGSVRRVTWSLTPSDKTSVFSMRATWFQLY